MQVYSQHMALECSVMVHVGVGRIHEGAAQCCMGVLLPASALHVGTPRSRLSKHMISFGEADKAPHV